MFQLDSEFYRLPLRFDAARLAEEALQFQEDEWYPHPQGYVGNSDIPLVSVDGGINDAVKGPMRPTPSLERCPYIQQVLAIFGTVIGRARLMCIDGKSDAHEHVDTNYYWMHHVRIHIPAVTWPEVRFFCGGKSVHMAAGEAWIFDNWKRHHVLNPVDMPRIHLVADTVGSSRFWDLIERSERMGHGVASDDQGEPPRAVPFVPGMNVDLEWEEENFPIVMSPFEQQVLAARILSGLPRSVRESRDVHILTLALDRLHQQWHALWTRFRDERAGWRQYAETMLEFDHRLPELAGELALVNEVPLVEALRQAIVRPALNPEVARQKRIPVSHAPPQLEPKPQPVQLVSPLPLSAQMLTPLEPEKWHSNDAELAAVLPLTENATAHGRAFARGEVEKSRQAPAPAVCNFNSEHTESFPELLAACGCSLAVSTYQAGKVILLRAREGMLNTHFRDFQSPMGIAWRPGWLAVGAKQEVWIFRNFHDLGPKLAPDTPHDAVFLPGMRFTSGDIRIHEVGWVDDTLWAVNTRFSCLCTFDGEHNFVPRWRPPFVSRLAAEDRCHLNGMALVDGVPAYVTCHAMTDEPEGWRERKVDGGAILEINTGEVLAHGLSMPHSPRFYDGRLWFLESGRGRICALDLDTGKPETVAELPGFTRGLDFYGPFAFVGLSQVRESAVFSGIPISAEDRQRECGVWVLDIRTGQTVALLRFSGDVQEIFSLQVLPGIAWPELLNEENDWVAGTFYLPPEEAGVV